MKKQKFIPTLLLIIGLALSAFVIRTVSTGTIAGSVTDAQTGEALPFANLVVEDKAQNVIAGGNTDISGQFKIANVPVGTWDVRVHVIGYQPKIKKQVVVQRDKTTSLQLQITSSEVELEEVVIIKNSEDAAPAIIRDNHAQQVVTRKDLQYLPTTGATTYSNMGTKQLTTAPAEQRYFLGSEQYDEIVENTFKSAQKEPLSTFSIDVDAASYANVRRFINENQTPPKDAVRVEEMINYFDYDYPNPKGEHPFSIVTEMSECPWNSQNRLIHIGIQGKRMETADLPPNNLVFLLDVSGSMSSYNKLELVKKSLKLLVQEMRPQDRVAIAVYAGAAGLVLESTPGDRKEQILGAIQQLQSGGSTAGGEGIRLAYEVAKRNFNKEGNNRVILCTDGDFNVGVSSDNELVALIEEKREIGVYLTVLGYGMGNYKDSKMEKLADKGNGNYAYIDNIMEAKKVLVNEMGATLFAIAKDVKIQVEFNPAVVESYKLIGYENRMLAPEDFNDDKKDAGELGAGHSVTALYEVVPKGASAPEDHSIDRLRYQSRVNRTERQPDGDFNNEIMTVKFRYKPPASNTSKLIVKNLQNDIIPLHGTSQNFKFSAAVAEFGLLLRNSEFVNGGKFGDVILLARAGKGPDANGYRAEFIRLVEQMELQANN